MKLKNLLKGVVRAAGALVGSQIGGPAGAALGAGLATKLTGGSTQDALLGGVISGIGAYGLGKFGGKLGLSTDGMFGAPAGAGGDMGYINSEAGGQSVARGIGNFATSPAGLAALGAGALALGPSEAPAAAPTAPARDNRTLEQMGYDTSPLERTYRPYEGDPYAYGEAGGEQRFYARGGKVRRGIAHFDEGGSVDAPDFSGYDTSSIDASGGIAGGLAGTGFSFDADSGVSTPPTAVDFSVPAGMSVPATQTAQPQNTSIVGRGITAITNYAKDAMQNPGRTAANAVINYNPVGLIANAVSKGVTGSSLGTHAMNAIQSATGYKGDGLQGDADEDGAITSGDDYANYTGPQYDPGAYGDGPSYLDPGVAGKVDGAAPVAGTDMATLQPVSGSVAGLGRLRLSPSFDPLRYGETGGEARFYAAGGGLARGLSRGPTPAQMAMAAYERGGKVAGEGDGQDDKIPAMLSDGEYVWSASDVAAMGQGSNEAGARKLDKMRKMVRKQAGYKNHKAIQNKTKGIGSLMRAVS